MYGSWGSRPSMGSHEPGGSNNGGNNGGNNSGTYYLDGDRDHLDDIKDPLDRREFNGNMPINEWIRFWGISKENVHFEDSAYSSKTHYRYVNAKAICRSMVSLFTGDDIVFLVKMVDTTYIIPVLKKRDIPLQKNVSITTFKFSLIPNQDDMTLTPVKYCNGEGLSGEGYLTVHSVIRLGYYPATVPNKLWVEIDGQYIVYNPSNMNQWGKDIYFIKDFYRYPTKIKLGKVNDFINPKVDKQITSANFMANTVIFKPYISEISAAFQAERNKLAPSLITYLDTKAKIPC